MVQAMRSRWIQTMSAMSYIDPNILLGEQGLGTEAGGLVEEPIDASTFIKKLKNLKSLQEEKKPKDGDILT